VHDGRSRGPRGDGMWPAVVASLRRTEDCAAVRQVQIGSAGPGHRAGSESRSSGNSTPLVHPARTHQRDAAYVSAGCGAGHREGRAPGPDPCGGSGTLMGYSRDASGRAGAVPIQRPSDGIDGPATTRIPHDKGGTGIDSRPGGIPCRGEGLGLKANGRRPVTRAGDRGAGPRSRRAPARPAITRARTISVPRRVPRFCAGASVRQGRAPLHGPDRTLTAAPPSIARFRIGPPAELCVSSRHADCQRTCAAPAPWGRRLPRGARAVAQGDAGGASCAVLRSGFRSASCPRGGIDLRSSLTTRCRRRSRPSPRRRRVSLDPTLGAQPTRRRAVATPEPTAAPRLRPTPRPRPARPPSPTPRRR